MSVFFHPSQGFELPIQPIEDLDDPHFSIGMIAQKIFVQSYLLAFDRPKDLVLSEKEFEVIDSSICRVTHGATHASRVAAYVKIMHLFRADLSDEPLKILDPLSKVLKLSPRQIIHLTQIVGIMHDAARRSEGIDRWDDESSELCLRALQKLFPSIAKNHLTFFAYLIAFKDDPRGYIDFLEKNHVRQEEIPSWCYLRELIHDADCLDVMRVRKTFKVGFLDVSAHMTRGLQQSSLLDLVCEVRDLIRRQGDMYKDHTVQHTFLGLRQIEPCSKHFSIELKRIYEHADNVYQRVTSDMRLFPWLQSIEAPIFSSKMVLGPYSSIQYPKVLLKLAEELVIHRDGDGRVYYGGPVDTAYGARWIMPAVFFNKEGEIRAAFDICFINCLPSTDSLEKASVYFTKISDLDLKVRMKASELVHSFVKIVCNTDPSFQGILIRQSDISNICYPHIYNAHAYSDVREEDKDVLVRLLQKKWAISSAAIDLSNGAAAIWEKSSVGTGVVIEKRKVSIALASGDHLFFVEHYLIPQDPWGSYYLFSPEISQEAPNQGRALIRIDSGCHSGMIYRDERCTCQSELEEGLNELTKAKHTFSLLIHIPTHDGRGMGTAPKGETEIYKRGGKGRLRSCDPLGDVEAARVLFETEEIDIRSYDGCAALLKSRGIHTVALISRSERKKKALERAGLIVEYL